MPVASSSAVVGGSGVVTYIEDLQATPDSEPYDTQGVAQVNGVSYPHSQGAQFCFGSNERKWTYVLGRKYSSFRGIIGLSDNSVSTAKIQGCGSNTGGRSGRIGDDPGVTGVS